MDAPAPRHRPRRGSCGWNRRAKAEALGVGGPPARQEPGKSFVLVLHVTARNQRLRKMRTPHHVAAGERVDFAQVNCIQAWSWPRIL